MVTFIEIKKGFLKQISGMNIIGDSCSYVCMTEKGPYAVQSMLQEDHIIIEIVTLQLLPDVISEAGKYKRAKPSQWQYRSEGVPQCVKSCPGIASSRHYPFDSH